MATECASVDQPLRKKRVKIAWRFSELAGHEERYLRQPDIHLFADFPSGGEIGLMEFPDSYEKFIKTYKDVLRNRD
jgi:hypothetical protein